MFSIFSQLPFIRLTNLYLVITGNTNNLSIWSLRIGPYNSSDPTLEHINYPLLTSSVLLICTISLIKDLGIIQNGMPFSIYILILLNHNIVSKRVSTTNECAWIMERNNSLWKPWIKHILDCILPLDLLKY